MTPSHPLTIAQLNQIPCQRQASSLRFGLPASGGNDKAAFFNSRDIAAQVGIPYWKLFIGVLMSGYANARQLAYMANAFKAIKVATEDGDDKTGVLPVGQVQGLIHDQPTVKELFERIVEEAKQAQGKVNQALE